MAATDATWELAQFDDWGTIIVDGKCTAWWDVETDESFIACDAQHTYRGDYMRLGEGGDPSRAIALAAERCGLPLDELIASYEKQRDEAEGLLRECALEEGTPLDALEAECSAGEHHPPVARRDALER